MTHDSYASLRLPGFRWFIASLLTQTLAIQLQGVVVGWQVYQLTRDPLALGLVGLAEAIPFIGFALPAGQLADRADRRRICLAALSVLLICAASLLALTTRGVTAGRVGAIYAIIFASGIARSFLQPTRTALAADLVPRETYVNSITWRSSTWQFAAVAGPAVGGLLYAIGGAALAYAVDTGLLAIGALCLWAVRHRPPAPAAPAPPPLHGLLEGVRFVRRQPLLLGALTLDLFAVLFGGAEALLPVFAGEILRVGPTGLGILRAAPAVGAVVMSVYLSHRPVITRAGRRLFLSVAGFGVCMIGFGLSQTFALSLALLLLGGMLDNVSVVLRSTLLQTQTPSYLLGRVAAVNSIFIGSSNEIGAFESGVAARIFGTVPSVVLGGCITLVVVGAVALWVPELRRLEQIG